MRYQNSEGKKYLIYLYSEYKNSWKIETLPFDGSCQIVSELQKNQFIKSNRLKVVKEQVEIMYRAWGILSGKTYLEAETKEDVWKMLLIKFPSFTNKKDKRGQVRASFIYPEPLKITKLD